MDFRAPHMTYAPLTLEGWEKFVAFTLIRAPFEEVQPVAAGVIRHREGPMGEMTGERRPPLMVRQQTPEQIFNGTLVFSPKEAPGITLIEHPLDDVAPEDFPTSLAKVLPDADLVTIWSDLATATRQEHGFKVTRGENLVRYVRLTRGYESSRWSWEASGEVQAFEDAKRLAAKKVWDRLDRRLLFDYATAFGIDPERSLFGRHFAQSVLYYPLPYTKATASADMTTDHAAAAEIADMSGVQHALPKTEDAEFASNAEIMSTLVYWDRELSVLQRKAWESSQRAKTPAGRERAQWRVIEGLQRWKSGMEAIGMTSGFRFRTINFESTMKDLGQTTEAYRTYRALFPRIWEFWR